MTLQSLIKGISKFIVSMTSTQVVLVGYMVATHASTRDKPHNNYYILPTWPSIYIITITLYSILHLIVLSKPLKASSFKLF